MWESFNAELWLKSKGKNFKDNYADIKKTDSTLDAKKVLTIANARADMRAKKESEKILSSNDAQRLLNELTAQI